MYQRTSFQDEQSGHGSMIIPQSYPLYVIDENDDDYPVLPVIAWSISDDLTDLPIPVTTEGQIGTRTFYPDLNEVWSAAAAKRGQVEAVSFSDVSVVTKEPKEIGTVVRAGFHRFMRCHDRDTGKMFWQDTADSIPVKWDYIENVAREREVDVVLELPGFDL
jgi:hypothetical protein